MPDIAFYRLFTDGHVGDVQNLPRSTFFLRLRLPKKEGRDYTGHVPRLLGDPSLTTYVHGVLQQELLLSTRQALIIPPCKCFSGALQVLLADHRLAPTQPLLGFPHPSGANGQRVKQYRHRGSEFARKIQDWLGKTI